MVIFFSFTYVKLTFDDISYLSIADTATDILEYLAVIAHVLRPGE